MRPIEPLDSRRYASLVVVPHFSVVLLVALPRQVAGCKRRPPLRDGCTNPLGTQKLAILKCQDRNHEALSDSATAQDIGTPRHPLDSLLAAKKCSWPLLTPHMEVVNLVVNAQVKQPPTSNRHSPAELLQPGWSDDSTTLCRSLGQCSCPQDILQQHHQGPGPVDLEGWSCLQGTSFTRTLYV